MKLSKFGKDSKMVYTDKWLIRIINCGFKNIKTLLEFN